MGRRLGDPDDPLLVSVRSGAPFSMPGMMDTVLNLGLNDRTVEGLAAGSGDPRFAWDSYRRFIQMYSDVVLGVEHHHFEDLLDRRTRIGLARKVKLADKLRALEMLGRSFGLCVGLRLLRHLQVVHEPLVQARVLVAGEYVGHQIERGAYKQGFSLARNGLISTVPAVPV